MHIVAPMADNIGLKIGRPSVTILWTSAKPYIIPVFEPERVKFLCCLMKIFLLYARFLRTSYAALFSVWIR